MLVSDDRFLGAFFLAFSKSMTTCEIPPLIPVITKGVVGHEAREGGAP